MVIVDWRAEVQRNHLAHVRRIHDQARGSKEMDDLQSDGKEAWELHEQARREREVERDRALQSKGWATGVKNFLAFLEEKGLTLAEAYEAVRWYESTREPKYREKQISLQELFRGEEKPVESVEE